MKFDARVFILSLLVGAGLILLDVLVANGVLERYSPRLFPAAGTEGHELFMRILIFVTFTVFGLLVARQVHAIRQAEKRGTETTLFLQQMIDAIPAPVFYKDAHFIYTGCNSSFAEYLGRPIGEIVGRTVFDLSPPHLAEVYHAKDAELMAEPGVQIYESRVKGGTAEERNVIFHKATFLGPNREVGGIIGIILDITDLRQAEAEREKLIVELRDALDKVKVLSGFLPICATCKKIRNDAGYWQQIEAFIREQSGVEFSHSICPDCAAKLLAEYEAEQQNKRPQKGFGT